MLLWVAALAFIVWHVRQGLLLIFGAIVIAVVLRAALILGGIIVCHLLFGTMGVVLAAPITVVVYRAVKMICVEDPLEEGVAEAKRP